MMWLIEGMLIIIIALLIVLIICKCKDYADKFEEK
jgi:hypothetical protein